LSNACSFHGCELSGALLFDPLQCGALFLTRLQCFTVQLQPFLVYLSSTLVCCFVMDQKRRPEGVNGSLKFLLKLSTTIPKLTPKRHTNKSYITRATKSQETLEKFLRSLETQRKRRNSNRRSNGRETNKTAQNKELRTVCYSIPDSPLQCSRRVCYNTRTVSGSKIRNRISRKQSLQYPGQFGLRARTVCKYGYHAAKKAQKKAQLSDCSLQYFGLSTNRESARIESSENCLLLKFVHCGAKSKPIGTKF
jgi:hypothetical protein